MADKNRQKCSISLVMRKMQIKTKIRYRFMSAGIATIKKTDKCVSTEYGATGTLIHCWWGCEAVQTLGKTIWQFLTKSDISLSSNAATLPLRTFV